jgi:hypothetical protein
MTVCVSVCYMTSCTLHVGALQYYCSQSVLAIAVMLHITTTAAAAQDLANTCHEGARANTYAHCSGLQQTTIYVTLYVCSSDGKAIVRQ